ncbi:hypothetical protein [Amycolatopsis pigmentata]|uniref:PE-PGRS family protein n=1 Tax=Amycolatopsis pigmentata TaxID=450801 RepID=A0ABW5FVW3_9PSEU
MQTWARRGIQTALVTGGLLMLGTGIASADENNGSPDSPAGPVDINASVPVQITKNAVGALGKQANVPAFQQEVSTRPATGVVNKAIAPLAATGALKPASPAIGAANGVAATASQAGQRLGRTPAPSAGRGATEVTGDPCMGNKITGDLVVPIQVTGNAIGLFGNAEAQSDSVQSYSHGNEIATSGAGGGLAGNVVALDWALPVQISGNAVGLGGRAKTSGSAAQSGSAPGDITTDGTNGGLSGNVISPQGATPVQVSGNALGLLLGHANSSFAADSSAASGGSIATHGSYGVANGNVAGVPVALPVKASSNGISALGNSDVCCSSAITSATAGSTRPGMNDIPTYIQTDGAHSLVGGTVVQPQPAVPGTVAGDAAAVLGHSSVGSAKPGSTVLGSTATSGGFSSTTGEGGALSGTIADVPAAAPAEVFCTATAVIGHAHANGCENTTTAVAGSGTYTNGNGGFVAGNSVSPQPAGTAELFGTALAAVGQASGAANETKHVKAGGYNGSQGNDSSVSGNVVQAPVGLPAEVFGMAGSLAGQSQGSASETKTVTGGGGGNTQDDHGTISANLVQAPLSAPVQAFGSAVALVGRSTGSATTYTTSSAGGDGHANGKEGVAAGNLAALPESLPVQLHGLGVGAVGKAFGQSQSTTQSFAGGNLSATGEGGAIAGNIVEGPGATLAHVFGTGAAVGGLTGGTSANDVTSLAGGTAQTDGDRGAIAGNVVAAQLAPIAQVFGPAVGALGTAQGTGANGTNAGSGGDITTSGKAGTLSGDIFDVPVGAVAQVFGDAVAAAGIANGTAANTTTGTVGGTHTTTGANNALSGIDSTLPIGVMAQVFDVPLALLGGIATAHADNATSVLEAGQEPKIDLPVTMSELPATSLPSLPRPVATKQTLPVRSATSRADFVELPGNVLSFVPGQLPSVPAGQLPSLPGLPAGARADQPTVVSGDLFSRITDLVYR